MKLTLTILFISAILNALYSQSKLDTLIGQRKTDIAEGKVNTYYSPGNKEIALELQKTITDAVNYYEKKFSRKFNVKLAVLDSGQWVKEYIPYGFIFYDSGWMVMNTGMSYSSFKEVYGLKTLYTQLDSELKENKLSSDKMISSFYKVYCIHELGHYFINRLSKAKSPDNWSNEFIATYFAFEYFTHNQPEELKAFELFHQVDRDHYKPKYSSIKDLNEIYEGMGVENYLWYHSNIYFLVKSLYNCKGDNFISIYEDAFPKNLSKKLTTSEIVDIVDKGCNGIVRDWVTKLEAKTKK